jgi:hypothetical protein
MKPETRGKIKHGVWGLVVGSVITMIIGFAWGVGQHPARPKR